MALELTLVLAALVAGLTGAWSPCGFSMVETIGPRGHSGGRGATLAACATFGIGATAGGALTFGALGLLGELVHGAAGRGAYLIAAAVALGAAALELRGGRIVPQVRRQLPEPWRWRMPMPVVAAIYGVLLGLGFTTFVLTFGVWALAAISFALGDPALGAAVGVAFGIGRAIPVVGIAPLIERPAGMRMTAAMAERPGIYRGFRLGDALCLLAAAGALGIADGASASGDRAGAEAAGIVSADAADPSAAGGDLVFEDRSGQAVLLRDGQRSQLPGSEPAAGGSYIAVRSGDAIKLLDRHSLAAVASYPAQGVTGIGVSSGWLAWRAAREGGGDVLLARRIGEPADPGRPRVIARSKGSAQVGVPDLDHGVAAFAVERPRVNRIAIRKLGARRGHTIAKSRHLALFAASIHKLSVAYVVGTRRAYRLVVRNRKRRRGGRVVTSRRRSKGMIWTTALSGDRAYFTYIYGQGTNPRYKLLSVAR